MKRLILASLLLAAPVAAMAQQAQYTPLNETLLHQAEQCEVVATNQIAALNKQAEADKKQIANLTKQGVDQAKNVTQLTTQLTAALAANKATSVKSPDPNVAPAPDK